MSSARASAKTPKIASHCCWVAEGKSVASVPLHMMIDGCCCCCCCCRGGQKAELLMLLLWGIEGWVAAATAADGASNARSAIKPLFRRTAALCVATATGNCDAVRLGKLMARRQFWRKLSLTKTYSRGLTALHDGVDPPSAKHNRKKLSRREVCSLLVSFRICGCLLSNRRIRQWIDGTVSVAEHREKLKHQNLPARNQHLGSSLDDRRYQMYLNITIRTELV